MASDEERWWSACCWCRLSGIEPKSGRRREGRRATEKQTERFKIIQREVVVVSRVVVEEGRWLQQHCRRRDVMWLKALLTVELTRREGGGRNSVLNLIHVQRLVTLVSVVLVPCCCRFFGEVSGAEGRGGVLKPEAETRGLEGRGAVRQRDSRACGEEKGYQR